MTHAPTEPKSDAKGQAGDAPVEEPSPRAFALGTGFVFQSIGPILMFGACCFWSFSGRLVERASEPASQWTDYLTGDRLPAALLTIGVATTVVGGLGLGSVGIALHGERVGAGRAAVIVTAATALIYWILAIVLVVHSGLIVAALTAGGFAVLFSVFLVLALESAAVHRRFPPPEDINVVTDEEIEELKANRRRRSNY